MICAIVLAGGTGSRMQANLPKQFLQLEGEPVILKTVRAFESHPEVDRIVLVCLQGWEAHLASLLQQHGIRKVSHIVTGGSTRTASVRCALNTGFQQEDILLIHDGARPFVSARIISDNIAAVRAHGACGTAIPMTDTVSVVQDGKLVASPDRSTLVRMQTPQSFRYGLICGLYQNAEATDDCTLALQAGIPVHIVSGEEANIKLTTPQDLCHLDAR